MDRRRFRARALVAIAAVVLGLSTQALLPSPAHAAPPAPTGLTSTGTPIPTLSWNRVPGAIRYLVEGSETSNFSTLVFSTQTVNVSYVPTRVLKEGPLYWRVQATDPSGTSSFAQGTATIGTHLPPGNVRIKSPRGDDSITPPASPPVIQWDSVAGATGYDVELDAEGDGVGGTVQSNVATTTYVWPDPQGVGERFGTEDFFVRVRARFDNSLQTDWSPYVKYDVTQLPAVTSTVCAAEAVCAPDAGTGAVQPIKTVQDVVFDWDPVKGAKQYEIWVALDQDFNNEVERRIVTGTRYSPSVTYDNNTYYWKVRPINAADQPAPWPAEPNIFQRRWPDRPTPVYPPVSSAPPVSGDFYYQWSPVRHASRYQLDVGTDPSFSPNSYSTCFTASTTFVSSLGECMPAQGVLTYWRVKAVDGVRGVEGIYSTRGQFVYDSLGADQVSPADGATVDIPTLRWAPATDAQTYLVSVYMPNGDLVTRVSTSALSWTPEQYELPDSGTFLWTVRSVDADGKQSPERQPRSFTLTGSISGPSGSAPDPLPSPFEPLTARFPQLLWKTVPGAAYYKIQVSETPGFWISPETGPSLLSRRNVYPTVTDDGTYFLRPGQYQWRVAAYSSSDVLMSTGATSTFTISTPDDVTGQQIALNGRDLDARRTCAAALANNGAVCDSVPATPVLDWAPVPGMGGYLVYIGEDPDFTNRVTSPFVATENSRWTPTLSQLTALPDNQSGQAYYWYVRPCVSVAPILNCGPDPVSQTDAATNAFRKVSPPVQPVMPAAGATETGTEVTFTWRDYFDTNAEHPLFANGTYPSHQTARSYRLQVARSATITDSNVIDDVTVDQTTYTAPFGTYPEGDLWWRVQAIDERGDRLAWSPTRKLVKASPANNLFLGPTEQPSDLDPLAYPVSRGTDLHIASGEVPFRWTPKDFDVTWQLEVYKGDDVTLSPANRVLSTYVRQAAFVPPSSLQPSREAYRWRVRRFDVTGRDDSGAWSDLGRFFVDGQIVNLDSPANAAAVPPNGPVLRWFPFTAGANQATRYSVDIRNAAGDPWESTSSTYATAYAPTGLFPTGTYTWQVTAYDPVGNVMGTSAERTFQVDAGLSALIPPAIQAPSGTGVGKTLTSTAVTWNQSDVATTYQWLRNGDPIAGANATTYVTTSADQDRTITLQATGRRPGYTDGTSVSNPIAITAGSSPAASTAPTVSGVAAARETLTADPGTWAGFTSGTPDFTYQWFVGDQAVARETGKSYVVRSRDAGLPVKVRVTATVPGYLPGEAFSAPVSVAKLSSKVTATISARKITERDRAVLDIVVEMLDLETTLGSVKVMDGSKVVSTTVLKSGGDGHIVIRLKKLTVGKHKLLVSYSGSAATNPSQAKPVVVKVVRSAKKK